MQIKFAALTDIGLKRNKNEDSYLTEKRSAGKSVNDEYQNHLFVIADGMGGHSCGEIASNMACKGLVCFLDKIHNLPPYCIKKHLKKKFIDIDAKIREHGFTDLSCMNMGTTLSAMVLSQEKAVIAHVGDCRIYHLHRNNLKLLTTDHSLVQEMVEEGIITLEEGLKHPFRNKLTHVIGTNEPLELVETSHIDINAGDRFILSTDGLHTNVSHNEIEDVLSTSLSPHLAAEQLLAKALQGGGRDNITTIVIFLI